jgi:exosortase E/protease (VPEID-CTERM system)
MHTPSPAAAVVPETSQRPTHYWRFWAFVAIATAEFLIVTFAFDRPRPDIALWRNVVGIVHDIAKGAILSFCLLLLALWPRRAEMLAAYSAALRGMSRTWLFANIALFVALIAARLALMQAVEQPALLLAAYCVLVLAARASLAFLVAPPAFWLNLVRRAPVEVAVALIGGVLAIFLGRAAQEGWVLLASATLSVSYWLLTLYEPHVIMDSERALLGAGDFSVLISAPCSGYEGIALILTFFSVYLWVFRRDLKFPNVLLLLPLGMGAIWLLNALRIALLVSIGAHVSPEMAIQGFHSKAGWINILLVMLGMVALTRRVPLFMADGRRAAGSAPAAGDQPDLTLAFLAPFMAMLAAHIFTSAFAPHDQWLYPVKVFAAGAALWWFRDTYKPLLAGVAWSSLAVGLAVGVAWIVTDPGSGSETPLAAWIATLPAGVAATWLAFRAIGSVAIAPIAEELAFRGFLARWLISTRFETVSFGQTSVLAFVGSSVAFGLMHQRWLAAALAGAVYALLMIRSGRLSDAIAAHAASNAVIVIWAVAARQWSLL